MVNVTLYPCILCRNMFGCGCYFAVSFLVVDESPSVFL